MRDGSSARCASIGVVFEDPFLFSARFADNIAYGRPDATDERDRAAAHKAEAHKFVGAARGL